MRLVCPNCDAQYEVPDEVIPSEGRDVQCSDCGQTWFQHHPDHMPPEQDEDTAPLAPEPDLPVEGEERVPAPEPKRRTLDPAVSDILRAEAEAEARVRESEGLETQPDLGLDVSGDEGQSEEAARRAQEARDRMARMRGQDPAVSEAAATAAAAGSRRDLLPDIEEINSTLRSTGDRQIAKGDPAPDAPVRERKKRGFRRGFFTSLLIVAVLTVIYVYSPQIVAAVPALEPVMTGYVGTVDQARVWLDSHVTSLLMWLDTTAGA
ncbi:zinc-ribbon domain-containing protein [Sulfitobacter pseudonitzschiae]|uniref:Zinc-ribbon domain-containing protein n=1 Tax=Pseudosulfitobacter pseudonitzschiae TaxID=1402135 RepID=A0A9Q2NZQ2_9RHOB|nr:zinc-ribbon domain-containing protein [Pseudosulfitobacter pseudonitzschiae]MBM2291705.1 zinc-ribbon domain-containing protein [Pseudosulfitobacter pseudonitzschiae]MBM2296623.1 zinc-ribbon domain-containing protein [Pseudosulfitobacter pseudonitzschiae]MBM2301536.1 zinc-ribbon domain-containing protein [Pseudosulfitobacter pseudonitzschiae]MBM2311320.1 zinc-ribbon domain-containing protein [Pseudosulfitobacter pseudonitzschiae]MBM2316233.1 zinc-ribbon domain-containing protein [Pseudosulfi